MVFCGKKHAACNYEDRKYTKTIQHIARTINTVIEGQKGYILGSTLLE